MVAHAKLGASSAHRWMNCPGSVALSEKAPPQPDSVAAREGTIAHELAAYCLSHGLYDAADAVDSVPMLAELDKLFPGDGAAKRKEMVDGVNVYLSVVYGAMKTEGDQTAALYVETTFSLDHVGPQMFGTCDAVVLRPTERKLVVADLKYGAGTMVAVEGNPQLQYYALGALHAFSGLGFESLKIRDVEIIIVQPRAFGEKIKRQPLNRADLFEFRAVLAEAAEATRKPDAPLADGTWCKYCPAKIICPKLEGAALEAAKEDFGTAKAGLTPEQVGRRMRIATNAEAWIKAVREFAFAEASAGRVPAGYEWTLGREGNREWAPQVTPTLLAGALGNTAAATENRLRSPAQIEKDIGKTEFTNRCGNFVTRKPASQVLSPVGSGRASAADFATEGF